MRPVAPLPASAEPVKPPLWARLVATLIVLDVGAVFVFPILKWVGVLAAWDWVWVLAPLWLPILVGLGLGVVGAVVMIGIGDRALRAKR